MLKIVFLEYAHIQFLEALDWYISRSEAAALGFVKEVEKNLNYISAENVTHKKYFGDYHELGLKKYPFIFVYRFEKEKNQQLIVAFFNTHQNPRKKTKYLRKKP